MSSAPKSAAVALLGLALLVRGGMLVANAHALHSDPDAYRQLAANLVERGTLGWGDRPSAARPPLYPLVLAPCVAMGPWANAAIALAHLVLGMLTVWLVYVMGLALGLGRFAPVAAALVACDPILLAQSTMVMTETVATLLAVLAVGALGWAGRRHAPGPWLLAGACLGLAVLCRPTFLPWAILVVVLALLVAAERPRRVLAMVLAAVLVVCPWVVRNQIQFGRPILTTTHGGYTLLWGNNPQFYEHLRRGGWDEVWDAEPWFQQRHGRTAAPAARGELDMDRMAYQEAWQSICREPGMFACASLLRVGRLWRPLPHQLTPDEPALRRWARYGVGLWYALELSLAALGTWLLVRGRRSAERPGGAVAGTTPHYSGMWCWWALMAGCFTAVHAVYWTDMRMRAPLMPGVALAASFGAAWLAKAARRRKILL